MFILATHPTHWTHLILAIAWMMAAALYYMAMRRNSLPVRRILRPIRLFGMWLSISWSAFFILLFADVFTVPTDGSLHQIVDGLLFVTVVFIMSLNLSGTRLFKVMGVE